MHRAKDRLFYENLKFLYRSNRLSYKDFAFLLSIPYQSLLTMMKRKTRIMERYGDQFAKKLGIDKRRLFEKLLEESEEGIHMYFGLEHFKAIVEEFYEADCPGRADYQVSSLYMICRLIANSPISLYIDYGGMVRVDESSIEKNYPLETGSSSSLIVVDNSSSVRDYGAAARALKNRQEAYEREVELLYYLANRINAFFPCFKGNIRYKKIMLYNLIYKKSHSQMKESFDYDGNTIEDPTEKIRSYRKEKAHGKKIIR